MTIATTRSPICFEKRVPGLGTLALRPFQTPDDVPLVHTWVTREYAKYWGMQNRSIAEVEAAYDDILRTPRTRVLIGLHDEEPAFLVECYSPMEDPVGECYEARPGDRGMHILVAPAERRIPDFTWCVFTAVMDFLFSDETAERIVVEPDVRNEKIHRLNLRAGFQYQELIQLPAKTAYLAFCTREQYAAALTGSAHTGREDRQAQLDSRLAHLDPATWSVVNVQQIRKLLREFAHELLLRPHLQRESDGWGEYRLSCDHPNTEYRFRAQVLSLDHWFIDAQSIERLVGGRRTPLDALSFILDVKESIAVNPAMLPTYLEEITRTLWAAAYKHANARLSAGDLVRGGFQDAECAMTDGHPSFVANSGRVGFDIDDYHEYAPECGTDVHLVWLAAHKNHARFHSISELPHEELMERELGAATLEAFNDVLRQHGLDPAAYLFIPVHPWQWEEKLAFVFAPDIAARKLVYLGTSRDAYRAQQSIRTFFNVSRPERHYVKTALSILNMGFVRGLSPYYMSTTPAINEWIHALLTADGELRECGFTILREVASIGYRHPHFDAVTGDHPYKKMLAALWRESPIPRIAKGERLITMAALLHRDRSGASLLKELIDASGIEPEAWLRRYLRCYLTPLLHCFYAHDLVFMPHGENLILVLRDNAPVRAIMKDIGEEAAILDANRVLPEPVRRLAISVPDDVKVLSIFTDVFDGIFRYLAEALWEHGLCSETTFWRLVASCVLDYQGAHPELVERFQRHDLFAPEFARSCLNRLQLANNQRLLDLSDPAKSLQFVGTLKNPIAPFASARTGASE